MMAEYTPTTGAVRVRYIKSEPGYDPPLIPSDPDYEEVGAEFDRWLAGVKAEAWDEGARHVYTEGGKCSFARDGDPCPYNPHREVES